MNAKEKQIEAILAPTVEANGCAIWGLEWLSSGRHSKLCLYIDRAEGVSVDDCERISREVGDVLDVEDALTQRYTLEVSSPGMDRILFTPDHYADSVGQRVDVRLNFPFEGRKRIVGLLAGVEDGEAVVQVDDNEFLLPLENIQRARVVPEFD